MTRDAATPVDEPLARNSAGLTAWRALIVSNSRLARVLDEEMQDAYNLTLGEFDVLATLAHAPGERQRMCDLATAVIMSASGLSRRVDRLERAGWVCRERSTGDGRSIEATLTAEGQQFFERASEFHRTGVRRHFADRFTSEELVTLAGLLGRIEGDPSQ